MELVAYTVCPKLNSTPPAVTLHGNININGKEIFQSSKDSHRHWLSFDY